MMLTNLWDLFHSHFTIGQELMILDSDDIVHIGKYISVSETGITLKSVFEGKEIFLYWTDIRFMGHDGFPIRKVLGADGSPSLEKEFKKGKNATKQIRSLTCDKEDSEAEESEEVFISKAYHVPVSRIYGGCPWMIDECKARIVNPGNSLQTHWRFWEQRYLRGHGWEDTDWEEALILTAPNGAIGELYDFESIYHFEPAYLGGGE